MPGGNSPIGVVLISFPFVGCVWMPICSPIVLAAGTQVLCFSHVGRRIAT